MRSTAPVLFTLLAVTACSKNGPGVIEGVASDVGNEIDGAGDSIDGVGRDVTDTVDGPPKNPPPAADAEASDDPDGAEPSQSAEEDLE